jgi:hypothetical protein
VFVPSMKKGRRLRLEATAFVTRLDTSFLAAALFGHFSAPGRLR